MKNHVALYMIVFFLFYALQGHLAYLICLFILFNGFAQVQVQMHNNRT